ncbi:MAG: CotH kinase family protein [Myxococcota bacterium]
MRPHMINHRSRLSSSREPPRHALSFTLALLVTLSSSDAWAARTEAPEFSVPRGFYSEPFQVQVSSATPDATIRYTIDGSTPSGVNGLVYTGPISVSATTVIRALATSAGLTDSKVVTHTYVFPASVVRQPNTLPGWPTEFAPTDEDGPYPADYEMDPDIVDDPLYSTSVLEALTDIATLSLVTDLPNLWDPALGIYTNAGQEGEAWERFASVELLNPDGTEGFGSNGGLRIAGNGNRRPKIVPKKSFRVTFRDELGPKKLRYPLFPDKDAVEDFDDFQLRGGSNNSWPHWEARQRAAALYMRDQFVLDSLRDMGHVSPHGRFVHVYLNGVYWGLYTLNERLTDVFMGAYFGGPKLDWDVITMEDTLLTVRDGMLDEYLRLMQLANAGVATDDAYRAVTEMLDVVNLADYMILMHYVGNTDWPGRNWVAARRRLVGEKFRFFAWDSELILEEPTRNLVTVDLDNTPARLLHKLKENPEFRLLFADRVYRHLFNTGALAPSQADARFQRLTSAVEESVVAESARWGDYVRDVYRWPGAGDQTPYDLYTRDVHWKSERERLVRDYFPHRAETLMQQYRDAGLFPTINPPSFSHEGGWVDAGLALAVDNSANGGDGDIFFTTDGTDPRLPGGATSPGAVNGGDGVTVPIHDVTHVKARVLRGGEWSALHEAVFVTPQDYSGLVINEIMFNPPSQIFSLSDDLEFIELKNGGGASISLAGVRLTSGTTHVFSPQTRLEPGGFVVVAGRAADFEAVYGFAPDGVFEGQLSNFEELVELQDVRGNVIDAVRYSARLPWPDAPDGLGPSLELTNPLRDNSLASSWQASIPLGGTPRAENSTYVEVPSGSVSSSSSSGAATSASSSTGGVGGTTGSSTSSSTGGTPGNASTSGSGTGSATSTTGGEGNSASTGTGSAATGSSGGSGGGTSGSTGGGGNGPSCACASGGAMDVPSALLFCGVLLFLRRGRR